MFDSQSVIGNRSYLMRQVRHYRYREEELLGRGAYSEVFRGVDGRNQHKVAIKVVDTRRMDHVGQAMLNNELRVLNHIRGLKKALQLREVIQEQGVCYIITDLYEGETLKQYLAKRGPLSSEESIKIFRRLLDAFLELLDKQVLHRDLKPTNIMLNKDLEPVIIDFGFSEVIIAKQNMTVYNVGSPSYMAPEAYLKTMYSEKSEVWALGVILYEMVIGTTPDKNVEVAKYFQVLSQQQRIKLPQANISPVCSQILQDALVVNTQNRATPFRLKFIIDKALISEMAGALATKAPPQSRKPHLAPQNAYMGTNIPTPKSGNNVIYHAPSNPPNRFSSPQEVTKNNQFVMPKPSVVPSEPAFKSKTSRNQVSPNFRQISSPVINQAHVQGQVPMRSQVPMKGQVHMKSQVHMEGQVPRKGQVKQVLGDHNKSLIPQTPPLNMVGRSPLTVAMRMINPPDKQQMLTPRVVSRPPEQRSFSGCSRRNSLQSHLHPSEVKVAVPLQRARNPINNPSNFQVVYGC